MTTPTCPACGAKFAHDPKTSSCNKCGLPDEIKNSGSKAIARWKRNPKRMIGVVDLETGITTRQEWQDGTSKRWRKKVRAGRKQRRRNKHGRQHA